MGLSDCGRGVLGCRRLRDYLLPQEWMVELWRFAPQAWQTLAMTDGIDGGGTDGDGVVSSFHPIARPRAAAMNEVGTPRRTPQAC